MSIKYNPLTSHILIHERLKRGGQWLAAARRWMQTNVHRGDTLTWNSGELVQIRFCDLEDLARTAAVAAVIEERRESSERGGTAYRLDRFINKLQERFPVSDEQRLDSSTYPEDHLLRQIDQLISTNKGERK